VIDPDDNIPGTLRSKLRDPSVGTPILPMANGVSIEDAVSQLLVGLGYQTLPAGQTVTIQEEGIAYEAKGNWMALAPEENNKPQEVLVLNLADHPNEIPEYLKSELSKRGLNLRDVVLNPQDAPPAKDAVTESKSNLVSVKNWPRDKSEIADALLLSCGVTFGVAETLSVQMGDGLRVDTRADRLFELGGKRTALFFQGVDPEIRKALSEKDGVRVVELNIGSLSSREVIARMLTLLGEQSIYREHRFAAANGSAQERLTVKAYGFQLTKRPLFITDRRIPVALHRFFFEKGLEIIYFQ
jgi:hypothetical protein